jgi:hypothetical protein
MHGDKAEAKDAAGRKRLKMQKGENKSRKIIRRDEKSGIGPVTW